MEDNTLKFIGVVRLLGFGTALTSLLDGTAAKITRVTWPKDKFVYLHKPMRLQSHHDNLHSEVIPGEEQPSQSVLARSLLVSIGSELFEPYSPSQSDMFAQDWVQS